MSKPRYRWWGYVKAMLRAYPERANDDERAAVSAAMEEIKTMPDGAERMKLVDLVFIRKTHQLAGAAMQIPCSYETAQRWHADFIRRVGDKFACNGLK